MTEKGEQNVILNLFQDLLEGARGDIKKFRIKGPNIGSDGETRPTYRGGI